MKKIICLMLVLLSLAALAACARPSQPTTPPESGGESTALPSSDDASLAPSSSSGESLPSPSEPDDGIDLEALLAKAIADHPGAGAQELCRAILESPYFTLFDLQPSEPGQSAYWIPGFSWDFKPKGVKNAACAYEISSNAALVVIEPADGTDPEALAKDLSENALPDWKYSDKDLVPDCTFSKVLDGKVVFALYYGNMSPVTSFAQKGRDYVAMFHAYFEEHPDADCLAAAKDFAHRQKIGDMYTRSVTEGNLRGFGVWDESIGWYRDVPITGFADGARFEPLMEPNEFIGYVFRLKEGVDADSFVKTLRDNANLAWNVCVGVNTVITETDGDRVLFMMCNE